jgi:lipoprotein-anchoring transpeptidase ErfK/SrfK
LALIKRIPLLIGSALVFGATALYSAVGHARDGSLTSDDLDAIDPNIISTMPNSSRILPEQPSGLTVDALLVAKVQVVLDRLGFSPGAINGKDTDYLERAKRAYAEQHGEEFPRSIAEIENLVQKTGGDVFEDYTVTSQDVSGPYLASIPVRIQDQGQLGHLDFVSVSEAIAERFHMDENFLAALNSDKDLSQPGTRIKVARTGKPLDRWVSRIHANKELKQVRAFDQSGKLLAIYPASIGSKQTPSPSGVFTVTGKAGFPAYTLAPDNGFEAIDDGRQVVVAPGPNNPVGIAWIGLSKPSYGIHGTPEPSAIGRAESNGCIRLTNWDAMELARLVRNGVEVIID